ncbi:putative iron-regulated membrane protein [Dysgonomonas sp. PH5-45]|uniref:PepSY-associated TM helix domain-containing protein n=1 Tax=unclassified Dysgonomonas TaxID=2630389 RepID=UPI002473E64B|nr:MULTISPECIES: PepSY-associated TM helix domain-containing protein [unclassified Dysgonomonas]MDH6354971.1 putative iron-regulated membrane protein [Dysgonomonas sp. PH5-45]MDH6387905.1 putative iron-regulated membrane protein [Dysgonomonas sp. PH5-37]
MRTFFKLVHKWLSIPAGIIIFIVCLTGSILIFEKEILRLIYPERYEVESAGRTPLPLSELIPMANKQLKNNSVAGITVSSNPNTTYTIRLSEGFRSSAFIDQYTGRVTGVYMYNEGFFYKMLTLHRWLMDGSRTWGKYTVGISTILFVVILISGVVVWVPKKGRKWKSRFVVTAKKGRRRLYYDLHVVLGIYVCIFLLVCSLTGLMWSFQWYRDGVFSLFGAEAKVESAHGGKGGNQNGKGGGAGGKGKAAGEGRKGKAGNRAEKQESINIAHWDDVLAELQISVPNYKTISLQDGSASVLTKDAPHLRANDSYRFDAQQGNITEVSLYKDAEKGSKVMLWAYNLHVGAYGGIWTRILTCIACLIGASLPITGYYLFFVKEKRKKDKKATTN